MNSSLKAMIAGFFLVGCMNQCESDHSSMSPEEVVESYLEVALNMENVEQIANLKAYTTGALKEALKDSDPETIQRAYLDKIFKIQAFAITQRTDRTPRETEVTFQLSYHTLETKDGDINKAPLTTTENTLSLLKEDGIWYIAAVIGARTSLDFPISGADVLTPRSEEEINSIDEIEDETDNTGNELRDEIDLEDEED